jgi:predicted DNA binding CopG/RHH family protein
MNQTTLFPPFTAVRTAWAITGKFIKEEESKLSASIAEDDLKEIKKRAENIGGKEQQYIDGAVSTTLSTLRSLEIVLKGRNLNFDENQKIKDIYLENVKDNIAFGNTAKDFFKSLPIIWKSLSRKQKISRDC